MGAMAILAVGAASFAVFYSGKSGISDKFSTSSLFPPIEAHAALAGKDDFQSPRVSSPLLPQAPEYDDGSLVLDEIVPDEDPLDGGRLAIVRPRLDQGLPFTQPLAVHNTPMSLPLPEVSEQIFDGGDVIEKLLPESESIDESEEDPWIEHTVGKGERLVDISRKYGIFVATITKANNIANPNRLSLGQVLLIPRTEAQLDDVVEEQKRRAEEQLVACQKADPVEYKNYTVKNGDSLWTIASANSLSIDTLYGTNVMRNPDKLLPGMVLRIPNQDGLSVKIAKGQTLTALAKKYGVAEQTIRMANRLDDKMVPKAGEEIFVPGASQTVAVYRGSSSGGGASRKAPEIAKAPTGAAGRFSWPLRGKISSPFGWRRHPIGKVRSFHTGVDIRSPRHTPIRAARGGQVIFAGWMNGYGRAVVIRHDGAYTTLYAHAQTLKVRKGENVTKGTVIATVGTSGRSTGPHLHFEVRVNNKPTNPMSFLR